MSQILAIYENPRHAASVVLAVDALHDYRFVLVVKPDNYSADRRLFQGRFVPGSPP